MTKFNFLNERRIDLHEVASFVRGGTATRYAVLAFFCSLMAVVATLAIEQTRAETATRLWAAVHLQLASERQRTRDLRGTIEDARAFARIGEELSVARASGARSAAQYAFVAAQVPSDVRFTLIAHKPETIIVEGEARTYTALARAIKILFHMFGSAQLTSSRLVATSDVAAIQFEIHVAEHRP